MPDQIWDPFGDLDSRGILRNALGTKDPSELAVHEFLSIRNNTGRALAFLSRERVITLRSWSRTHGILFREIYPWAGRLRRIDVVRREIRFNLHHLVSAQATQAFETAARPGFADRMGEVYGELAFNHPFMDGNGRSLNFVFTELCRRNGFLIAFMAMDRSDYLNALTRAVGLAEYYQLQGLLVRYKRPLGADPAAYLGKKF